MVTATLSPGLGPFLLPHYLSISPVPVAVSRPISSTIFQIINLLLLLLLLRTFFAARSSDDGIQTL